jgi:hypothetical protein
MPGTITDMGSDDAAIRGGTPTDGDPAVVAIVAPPVACGAAPATTCSGAVIGPRAVLTAAHCVTRRGALEVVVGPSVDRPTEIRRVIAIWSHPEFDDADNAHDLAVLLLDRPVTSAAPSPLADAALDAGDVGALVRLVGYGADGDGAPPGDKRTGTAEIAAVGAVTFDAVPAPAMSCQGDSGGPVLLDRGAGEVIVGVTSSGDPGCVAMAVNVDVGAYRAFLDPLVVAAAEAPDPPGDGPIRRDAICREECAADADCPEGLTCGLGFDGMRCLAPGLAAGDLGASCDDAADCAGAVCARLPGGAACACLEECATASPPESGCGCDGGTPPPTIAQVVVIALLFKLLNRCVHRI